MPPTPGIWFTFFYYFSFTACITALVISGGTGISIASGYPFQIGVLFGLVGGGIGTYFNRNTNIAVAFRDRRVFLKNLNEVLADMGFTEQTEMDELLVYEKSTLKMLFSGRIFVKIEGNSAAIAGRASNIRKLQQKL